MTHDPTFTVICHINGQLITVPEDLFTLNQRSAIRHILSRIGKDPEPRVSPPEVSSTDLNHRRAAQAQARQQGYTGDACLQCQGVRVKQSGKCTVCEDCGNTSGCS